MITLIKSFSFETRDVQEMQGGDKLVNSFSILFGTPTSSIGDGNLMSSFSVAHGGYEIDDGVILLNELNKTNIIRIK